ncbi:MAG TPA: methylated-DNA--[protein]-cysteine S-methyltransferase [Terracidiphilus sp.]|nr:methylated-DNA--[protein]-cysteine S-methyltransferase [Terracidiphilus sp.]
MPEPLDLFHDLIETPIGSMTVVVDLEGRLRAALFTGEIEVVRFQLRRLYGNKGFTLSPSLDPSSVCTRISHYFDGELSSIDTIPVETAGTAFQREVWQALRGIPCGTTTSYGELARRIGRPAAVRAVGAANGDNPAAVVVPCHRVIGSNGSLTGYGGGIERKRWLLDHENRATRLF